MEPRLGLLDRHRKEKVSFEATSHLSVTASSGKGLEMEALGAHVRSEK